MDKNTFKSKLFELVLTHPPELPMMSKGAEGYDRIREKDFFRKMAFWVFPGIDTSCFALQVFQLINWMFPSSSIKQKVEGFLDEGERNLKKFILSCYDRETRGFFQTKRNSFPTLHATHCVITLIKAISALKSHGDIDFDGPLGKEKIEKWFSSGGLQIPGGNVIESILLFVGSCFDSTTGGFREIPNEIAEQNRLMRAPSINATASAVWIGYQLEEDIAKYIDLETNAFRKGILAFVEARRVIEKEGVAYRNSIQDERPWVCATYYAERISRNLGERCSIQEFNRILSFIERAKQKGSGFSAGDTLDVNLIHTKNAMSLIRRYYTMNGILPGEKAALNEAKRSVANICEDVVRFLKKTYVKGGFSTAEKEKYLPNVYTTRMAYDILRYVDFFVKELGIEKPSLHFIDPEETIGFIFSCYDKNVAAFRGFSYDTSYIPQEYMKSFFSLAA